MPEYLEDPSVLTKEKLKSELLANNVALPSGDQRKEVYVRLYLSSLTVQNQRSAPLMDAFSSDEELPAPVLGSSRSRSGRKATRKTDKPSPEEMDVTELTSEGLKDELLKYGVNAGPIVASTRKLYERKLLKLLDQGPPPLAVTPAAVTEIDSNHNGNSDSDRYSDKEEETPAPEPAPEPEPEPVPVPVVERPVRSRGKTPVTTRTRSSQHNRTNEQLFDEEEDDDDLGDLDEAQPVLNVKRKMRRTSFRADQTAAVRDETDQSEWSAAEVAPALHTTPRHATPKGIPNDPRPLLADLPDKTSHLFHGSSKTKLPAQASPLSQTALLTQPKRKSLPLPKPKAPSQPWSTSAVSPEAVHMGRPHSPSYSPKGMQPPLQHTSEALLPCDTEGWAGLKPRGPSRRIHLHKPPQGHRAPDSTQVLPTWQPNWKPSEEDVNLPLTPFQTASPSPLSLLNTALIQDPDQSPDAPVGKITRPQRLAPYKVFPPEVSPLLVGPPSKLSAWPQTRGDPGAFCFSPVGQISSTPLPTQLSAHAGFAQFNSPDEPLSLDQHESTDVPLPKWRHSKIPLIQSSTVTPIRRRGAVSLPSKDPCLGEVEKIAAGDQTSRMDEGDILKEMYPNKVNTPTGINATCRQPIRGAAGRPLKSSDLWLENSLLHSPRETTSTSSFKESRVVHRVTSLSSPPPFSSSSSSFSSSSRLVSAAVAPPTVQPKARRGWSMWLQLLLLSVLAGFLFFVYQTMETNAMSPFGGSSSSSGSAQVGSDSTSK